MKIPKYKDVGSCVLTPDIQEGKVRVIVNIKGSEDQSTANLNSKELRELADYLDSLKKSCGKLFGNYYLKECGDKKDGLCPECSSKSGDTEKEAKKDEK